MTVGMEFTHRGSLLGLGMVLVSFSLNGEDAEADMKISNFCC